MCFFGYVYEEIVDIPNMIFSAQAGEVNRSWANYHEVTNPVHYYGLVSTLGIISLILIWANKKHLSKINFKKVKIATALIGGATLLTIIAVTQINDFVFFNKPIEGAYTLGQLSIIWAVINLMRLSLTFFAVLKLISVFKVSPDNR